MKYKLYMKFEVELDQYDSYYTRQLITHKKLRWYITMSVPNVNRTFVFTAGKQGVWAKIRHQALSKPVFDYTSFHTHYCPDQVYFDLQWSIISSVTDVNRNCIYHRHLFQCKISHQVMVNLKYILTFVYIHSTVKIFDNNRDLDICSPGSGFPNSTNEC